MEKTFNQESITKSLAVWQLNSNGEGIPLVHERVTSLLEIMNPGKWGQDVLDLLVSEGWVRCNIYGCYELTAVGLRERRKLSGIDEILAAVPKPVRKDVKPWETFRKLIPYYVDCVKRQEKSQEYLFDGDYGKKYFLPVLPYAWLKELGEVNEEFSVPKSKDNLVAINSILSRREYEEEVFIGYPIESFYSKGKTHYVPITLIPVDIRVDATRLYISLRLDEADINHSWLDYHVNLEDRKALLNILTSLHKDDEYRGLIDIKRSLPYLERYARGCKPHMFDSDSLTWVLPRLESKGSMPCNCAALFAGSNPKYSRSLIRELRYIGAASDDVLDSTALAYVFREPRLKPEAKPSHYAFPFIDTNDEQQLAVTQALNAPVTLITGPPGTGKSQVAVNIIANQILRNRSVLFASRNHKAVHAIAERSLGLSGGSGVPLVHFCSTPDGQVANEWFKKDIEELLAGMEMSKEHADQWNLEASFDFERQWIEIARKMDERSALETQLSKLQARVEELELQLRRYLNVKDRLLPIEWPDMRVLKHWCGYLRDEPNARAGWLKRILWRFRDSKRDAEARSVLAEIMPRKVNSALSSSYIRNEIEAFLNKLTSFKELCKEKDALKNASMAAFSVESARDFLADDMPSDKGKLVSALLHALTSAAESFLHDEESVKNMKNFQNSMRTQNKLFLASGAKSDSVSEAVLKYKEFSKIAPAWATTLLSLARSAPCLPAVYDTVIIDEASQCDVPPMIPALYRAAKAVIIGDPQQFPPVITMSELRNDYLLAHYHLNEERYYLYDYRRATAYSVIAEPRVMLTNHYRCQPDIAEYFNEAFYCNRLNIYTAAAAFGFKRAVDWVEVPNSIEREIDAVVDRVAELAQSGFKGSVGVVTPLRKYANILDERLNKYRHAFDGELIVNTVNAFQGGEKDVIIFMLTYTGELSPTQQWYLTASENRYIYNVAVSRARACLVLVGDRKRCAESSFVLLRKLADMPRQKNSDFSEPHFDSVWEERLYRELVNAGIKPFTQYHLAGRRLDMAVITDTVKLDIEVDGVRWHTAASGGRKTDDLWRDMQISSMGWKILRFWVYELEQDMAGCVESVKSALVSQGNVFEKV